MSRSFDSTSLTTVPSIAIVPPLISSSPASMRSRVDLPQPEGPTRTVNSPSAMSKPMPWITLTEPKLFSTSRKAREAMRPIPSKARLALHGAGRQAADHVALERVLDRRRRQRVDESGGHQQLPGRIVRREEVAEGDRERHAAVRGKKHGKRGGGDRLTPPSGG